LKGLWTMPSEKNWNAWYLRQIHELLLHPSHFLGKKSSLSLSAK
jgi:hypothetical protein